jgi:tetratricopeptide (TPR) repeat protein
MNNFSRKGAKAQRKSAVLLLNAFCIVVISHGAAFAQSPAEADALRAIKLATNPTSKLAAAEDFIAKFPNSNARLDVAEVVADEILKIKNGAVALALLDRARAVFTSEQEQEILKPVALEAYAIGNRTDDAFTLAREMLAKNPDDLRVLVRITAAGTDETRKKNLKYSEAALQYGLKAIALIEGGKKPAGLDAETWALLQGNLPELYQQTAILYLASGNTLEAKARLTKASTLSPQDPSNYALLARVINADYLLQTDAYEAMPDGKPKQDALKQLETLLDSMIDAYARAAGLATGRAAYQTLLQQVIPALTIYYKRRHNESIMGLQQLINRYRPRP